MSKKRISTSVPDELYIRLERIKRRYRFKSISELNVALLITACKYIEDAREEGEETKTNEELIEEMFNELGNFEPTPDGIVPIRCQHKSIDDGER